MIYLVTGANYDLKGKKVESYRLYELNTNFYYIKALLSEGYHKNFNNVPTNLVAFVRFDSINGATLKQFEKENKYVYFWKSQDCKLLDYSGNKSESSMKEYIILFKDMLNKKDNTDYSYLVLDKKGRIFVWKYKTLYKNVNECSNVNYNNGTIQVHAPEISEIVKSEENKWGVNFNKYIDKNKNTLNSIVDNEKCYKGILSMLETSEFDVTMGNGFIKMCNWVKIELYNIGEILKKTNVRERKIITEFLGCILELLSIGGSLYGGISSDSTLAPVISLTTGSVATLSLVYKNIKNKREIKSEVKSVIENCMDNYKNTLLMIYSLNRTPYLHKEVEKELKLDLVDLFPLEFMYNNFYNKDKKYLFGTPPKESLLDKRLNKKLFTRKKTAVRVLELASYEKHLHTRMFLNEEGMEVLAIAYFSAMFFMFNNDNKNQNDLGKCEVFKSDNYVVVSDKPFDFNTTLLYNSWYLYTFSGLCRYAILKELKERERDVVIREAKSKPLIESVSIIIEILKYRVRITNKCKFYVKPNNKEVTIYTTKNIISKTEKE